MSETTDQLRERLQQLLDLIGEEEVQTIAAVAMEEIPKKLVAIEDGIGAGELESVSRLAHGLKGDTGTLGINDMADLAKMLEGVEKSDFGDNPNDLLFQLKEAYKISEPVLKEFS
jgi:HPt (histidine-containing phosphotransfer) domain-containing protein